MKGRRILPDENGWLPNLEPGDYGRAEPKRMADGSEIPEGFKAAYWHFREPSGHGGCLDQKIHTVTEHEDGTITVTPSLLITGGDGRELWHGFLERGVWRIA